MQSYFEMMAAWLAVQQTEFYFRTRPSTHVSREAHVWACCELFFSRVYQFKERWIKNLKRLDRRTSSIGLPIEDYEREFKARFDGILLARHASHHETSYSDIQIKAAGLGELLAVGDKDLSFSCDAKRCLSKNS